MGKQTVASPVALPHPAWRLQPLARADLAVGLLVALQAFVLSWPNRSRFVNVWDSTLFSFAVFDYDFLRGHPHPPGYPVFVAFTRLTKLLVAEPHGAVQLASAMFGAAAVAMLYGLVREFASRAAAIVAASLLALSPTLVYNSALALSYTAEGFFSVAIAWLAWRARGSGGLASVASLAAVFALGVGVRPSLVFYMAPLVVWATWGQNFSWRRIAASASAGLAAGSAWFFPMVWSGGGLSAWLATTRLQSQAVVFRSNVFTDGWSAFIDHGGRLAMYLMSERGLFWAGVGLLAVAYWVARASGLRLRLGADGRVGFLLLWGVPSLLFFAFIFSGWGNGPRGYVLVLLPTFYAAYGLAAQGLADLVAQAKPASASSRGAVALLVAFMLPGLQLVSDARTLVEQEIVQHDEWAQAWSQLREDFPPHETAILTSYSWAFAQWHFSDYLVWGYLADSPMPGPSRERIIIETRNRVDDRPLFAIWTGMERAATHHAPAEIRRVVIMDFQIAGENGEERRLAEFVQVQEALIGDGWRILYFDVPSPERNVEAWFH